MTLKIGKIIKRRALSVLSLFMAISLSLAAEINKDTVVYRASTRAAFASGDYTPFWLVSNIHGLGAPELNNGYVRGEIFKGMSSDKRFDWGAGADITGAWNLPAPFAIRQLFAELHYRKIWVSIGSRNYHNEYNDRKLSTGDLLFSDNAMAIPQVRIGSYGYAPIWGTKGWLSTKLYLSYGMFTDSRWMEHWVEPGGDRTSGVLFCGKGLSFRIGNREKFPLTFDVGIEMGTQFSGTVYKEGKKIKMPSGFIDWIKAIVPLSGGESTPEGEQTNIQGNMTGEYSMNTVYSPAPGWTIRAYWEHYFEDHSQMTFEYGWWKDGLWGLELSFPENKFVRKFVFEYVSTADQTGAVNNDATPEVPSQVSGRDGYYTHYLYGAWQNWGMTIGSPLAISPLYNRNHLMTLLNTRFHAYHLGLEGRPSKSFNWRFLLTFSRNYGTYWRPLSEIMDNCSGLAEISYHPKFLKGWFANCALAWDKGKLLGNNFGGMISIGYEGGFSFHKTKKIEKEQSQRDSNSLFFRNQEKPRRNKK